MSGPKGRRVVHQPTAAQIRAANLALLEKLRTEAAAVRAEAVALARTWAERAPRTCAELDGFEVADVDPPAAGSLADEVQRSRTRIDQGRARLRGIVARCAAEEAARLARAGADRAELQAAHRGADGAAASVDFLDEAPIPDPSSAAPAPQVPAAVPALDDRTARVTEILARAATGVTPDVAAARMRQAAAADSRVEWDAAVAAARAAVDDAVAAEEARVEALRAERAVAARLHADLVGLDGDDVERWRRHLADVLDDRARLAPSADVEVAAVRAAAVRTRLVAVLEAAGCTHLTEQHGAVVGYVDHGAGGATRVRCDDTGLLLTPVAGHEPDPGEVRRIEELNCALDQRLRESAAAAGIALEHERAAGFGEVPLRVEEHPFATAAATTATADAGRRRRRAPRSATRRSS